MNDKWQDKLRNRMKSYEESAPEGLWEVLEKRMVSENIISGNMNSKNTILDNAISKTDNKEPVSKKLRIRRISIGVVAAAVILLFFVLNIPDENQINETLINKNQKTSDFADNSVSEINETVKSTIESTEETPISEIKIAENNLKITESRFNNSETSKFQTSYVDDERDFVEKKGDTIDDNMETDHKQEFSNDSSLIKNDSKDITSKQDVSKEKLSDNLDLDKKNQLLFASSNKIIDLKPSRWQTNVSISNTSSGSTETFPGYSTFALKENVNQQYAFVSQNTREEAYTDIKHDQPISFGLTLRYNLSEKWNITSGLTYSLLSSKLHSRGDNYFYDDRQKLHYIGVPLNIAYNFWQNNNFLSYVSVGGHVQKNITGKLSSNYYINNQLESSTIENISAKHLQWSVNSAVGIEYRVTDLLGLYAEPGIDYYFKNSSELETIYRDRPFSFNLRIGLRFNFNE